MMNTQRMQRMKNVDETEQLVEWLGFVDKLAELLELAAMRTERELEEPGQIDVPGQMEM